MERKLQISERLFRPFKWLRGRSAARAGESTWLRRARLEVEQLEDRTTPATNTLGLDALDFHWIIEQQRLSCINDFFQCRHAIDNATAIAKRQELDQAATTIADQPAHELILVDSAIPDFNGFLAQLEEGLPPGNWYDLCVIDAAHGGVQQITGILALYHHQLDAVHLFSHGAAGQLQIGADRLDINGLLADADELASWKEALTSAGDLLLYGCDVAAGPNGAAFVEQLHQLTGLDIAASTNDTGAARIGGDWTLETHLGEIGAAPLSLADGSDAWSGLLNAYTVTSKDDSGAGTLRQAILDANGSAGADTIDFAIPGAGVQTINLASALPLITDAVTINAATQPGFSGTPRVVLDGGNSIATGLQLDAGSSGSAIRGLAINSFTGSAIVITAGSGNNLIAANFLGSDAAGLINLGNGGWGIELLNAGANNVIGGFTSADRNVIVGNGQGGVALDGASVTGTIVEGNSIGVGADGATAIGNGGSGGILVTNDSSGNVLGGTISGSGNTIANNAVGIQVLSGAATILGNLIFGNTGLGIDLNGDGVTPNDPGDGDSGGNLLKNFPTVTSATSTGSSVTITGSLNSVATGDYRIELFANTAGDPTGYGEGQRYLGFVDVATDGSGNANFSATFAAAVNSGDVISATNTDVNRSVTSEFAANLVVNVVPVITSNGGGASASINAPENTTTATTVVATDDDGDPLTYSIVGGADAALFTIDSATGVLAFLTAPDFEAPTDAGGDNTYDVVVQVDDGRGASDVQSLAITITNVNEAPVAVADSYALNEDTPLSVGAAAGLLTNDSDVDGPSLSAVLVSGPTHGAVSLNADGSFTYTPNANYNGSDSFTYQASDGSLLSNVATVTFTIDAVNDAPVAVADAYALNEGTPLSVSAALGVLGNDSDIDGPGLSAVLVSGPTHGAVSLNADGSFTYTPNASYNGSDSFTYRASDGALLSNVATVTFTINPVNDPPVAVADAYSLNEDTPLTVSAAAGVLANDSDIDSPSLSAVLVSGPTHGALSLNADGSFTYTPNANYNGADSFTYQASDGALLSNVATVTLTINAVNDAPVAVADAYTLSEDTPLTVSAAAGVLANDSDIDGPSLSAVLVSGPTHGALSLSADGSFTYTPNANYNGSDSFTYRASDGSLQSGVVTVAFTINAVNDAPVAVADAYSLNEDTPLTVSAAAGVLANDSDIDGPSLSAVLVSGPVHGTILLNADGSFTFTPNANYNGADSFTYRASDGSLLSNVATVTLTINAVNDAPVAAADAYTLNEDAPLNVSAAAGVLVNDSDVDGPSLTAVLVSLPSHGALSLNNDGSLTYNPSPNYNGADSFTYQASDGSLLSNIVTVTFTINAVNDAPVAVADAYSLNEDSPLTVNAAAGLLANDGDVDGPALTALLVTGPAHGALSLNADGSFTYTPDANYNGGDSFTYRASDGSLLSNIATVNFTINAVNDAPVAAADAYTLNEDTPLIVGASAGVLANDSDIDSPSLAAILVGGPVNGSLTLNSDGSVTYTPNADYNGGDSFTYRASDGGLLSNIVTVTLTINAVNDAPVAAFDAYGLDEDTPLTVDAAAGVLANDADVDSSGLSAILVSGPLNGALTLNADGSFTYVPSANANGTDLFSYRVSDGSLLSNVATVLLEITPVNDAPALISADHDTLGFSLLQGTSLTISASSVLDLFADVDGDSLTVELVDGPAHAALTRNADGSFDFVPSPGFVGADRLLVRVTDGALTSETVVVQLLVTATALGPPPPANPGVPSTGGPSLVPAPDPMPAPFGTGGSSTSVGSSTTYGIGGAEEVAPARTATRVAANPPRHEFPDADKGPPQSLVRVDVSRSDDRLLSTRSGISSPPTAHGFQPDLWWQQSAQLFQDLDNLADDFTQHAARRQEQTLIVGAVAVTLTSGYVFWHIRTFYLLLSALAARPLWRNFDPLAVLDRWERREEDEDVEKLFD